MTQLTMTGDDWLSNRDRKAQAKAELARKKAALRCAKKLEEAADSLNEFMSACMECRDASAAQRADDGRILLVRNLMEYSNYLNAVYEEARRS